MVGFLGAKNKGSVLFNNIVEGRGMPKEAWEKYIGKVFGRLTVLERSPWSAPRRGRLFKCECECGLIVYVTGGDLKSKNNKSCGCLRKKQNSPYISPRTEA